MCAGVSAGEDHDTDADQVEATEWFTDVLRSAVPGCDSPGAAGTTVHVFDATC